MQNNNYSSTAFLKLCTFITLHHFLSLSLSQFRCKLFKNVNFKHYIDDVECACAGDETPLPSICILLYITLHFNFTT